jgi:hypothetical protein
MPQFELICFVLILVAAPDVVTALTSSRWPCLLYATCDEGVERFVNVFGEVHRETPKLAWFFDHAETFGVQAATASLSRPLQHLTFISHKNTTSTCHRDSQEKSP